MWSSLSAPILILGGLPVRPFRLLRTLERNSFLDAVPDQSVHLSCSMEKDTREGDTVVALSGADVDKVILTCGQDKAAGNSKNTTKEVRRRPMVSGRVDHASRSIYSLIVKNLMT